MNKPVHWADQTAERIIRQRGDKEIYTCASGISPSGHVHIGNFREIITTDLVVKALRERGKKVRFIYSWDDFDRLRKIPAGVDTSLEKFIGLPYSAVPSPDGKAESYGRYFENELERSLQGMNINPEFIYQNKEYTAGTYKEGILLALKNSKKIKDILDRYRKEPLPETYCPLTVYCSSCGKDDTKIISFSEGGDVNYSCGCGHSEDISILTYHNIKLSWRVDWPMRWAHYGVDFEPGGKDHSSDGGSYDTAKIIAADVYQIDAPIYIMYDFVRIKGAGGKISSSSGNVITLADLKEIYEPALIRWIFAGYRTNVEFAVSFDLDVLKLYEDFDRLERKYFGLEQASAKQLEQLKRAYELSAIDKPGEKMPRQDALRHLCNILQVNDFDHPKTLAYLGGLGDDRLECRLKLAENWIKKYAPEDFKFILNKEPVSPVLPENYKKGVAELAQYLTKKDSIDEKELSEEIYRIINTGELDNKQFFQFLYQLLVSKDKGPKLAHFLCVIGPERASRLLTGI